MEDDKLTGRILQVAFRVHTVLGAGLLESVYEIALAHELRKAGLLVATQVEMPVVYDGIRLDTWSSGPMWWWKVRLSSN